MAPKKRKEGTKWKPQLTKEEQLERDKQIEAAFTELRRVLALALAGKRKQEEYAKKQMEEQYNQRVGELKKKQT